MSKKKTNDFNLRDGWLKLSPQEQQGVTNFFNLHNAAAYVYETLSDVGREYIDATLRLNSEIKKEQSRAHENT